jgi:hypothetical protein
VIPGVHLVPEPVIVGLAGADGASQHSLALGFDLDLGFRVGEEVVVPPWRSGRSTIRRHDEVVPVVVGIHQGVGTGQGL